VFEALAAAPRLADLVGERPSIFRSVQASSPKVVRGTVQVSIAWGGRFAM
jgi:hypothetical protein